MIRTEGFPADATGVGARHRRASTRSRRPRPARRRPLLVLHGVDDAEVPVSTTPGRSPTPAGPNSELRVVQGAGHRLRHDPRAIATLLGLARPPGPSGAPSRRPAQRRARRDVVERVLEAELGAQPVSATSFVPVADEDGHVDRPHEGSSTVVSRSGRVGAVRSGSAARSPTGRRDPSRRCRPRPDTPSTRSRYGAHDVAHVAEVANRLAVAERDLVVDPSRSAATMRVARPGTRKSGRLPGPGVVEGAGADHARGRARGARRRASASAATLVSPYGVIGRKGVDSLMGRSTGSTRRTARRCRRRGRARTPAARTASSTLAVPPTLTRSTRRLVGPRRARRGCGPRGGKTRRAARRRCAAAPRRGR